MNYEPYDTGVPVTEFVGDPAAWNYLARYDLIIELDCE